MSNRQTVLVVEDDVELRHMVRTALALSGFDVQEAGDGLTALEFIEQYNPVAIVLDLGLPTVSGHMVLEEVCAQANMRQIVVIVVTGMPGEHLDLGAALVLQKPVSAHHVAEAVRQLVASGARREC